MFDPCVQLTIFGPLDELPLGDGARPHPGGHRPAEKEAALRAFVEHVVPGRSDEVRGGDRKELAATALLALPLAEVSAKAGWRRPRAR